MPVGVLYSCCVSVARGVVVLVFERACGILAIWCFCRLPATHNLCMMRRIIWTWIISQLEIYPQKFDKHIWKLYGLKSIRGQSTFLFFFLQD